MTAKKLQKNDSDYISTKVITMFLLALLGIFLLMVVYRLLCYGSTFIYGLYAVKGIFAAGVIAAGYGAVKYRNEKKASGEGPKKLLTGANYIFIGAVMIFCALALLYYDYTISIKMLYTLLPSIAVLYLIFHTYPREFFSISVICATGAVCLWSLSRTLTGDGTGKRPLYLVVMGLAFLGIELAIVLRASRNNGVLKIFGRKLSLLSQDATLLPVLLAGLTAVLTIVFSFVLGAMAAFYCMFAVFIYLFIAAVFYTVKLM
ncbi:MAG: hypothetical protein Q8878_05820 [Bacillota bacterium]|nr:hypothetical protein [Bacillota bacterium]